MGKRREGRQGQERLSVLRLAAVIETLMAELREVHDHLLKDSLHVSPPFFEDVDHISLLQSSIVPSPRRPEVLPPPALKSR
jgi:hypothetical protein